MAILIMAKMGTEIQLYWDKSDREKMITGVQKLVDSIYLCARIGGLSLNRSKVSLRGEIVAHALAGWNKHTNPIDIELVPIKGFKAKLIYAAYFILGYFARG